MPKRSPLNFNTEGLQENLEASAGHGVDALFGSAARKQNIKRPVEQVVYSGEKQREEEPSRLSSSIPARDEGDPNVRPHVRTDARPNDRTDELSSLTPKRSTKRHSFEFYEDQISRLKKLTLEKELRGESASMSDAVREALDAYFEASQKSELAERSNDRTDDRANDRPDVRSEKSPA